MIQSKRMKNDKISRNNSKGRREFQVGNVQESIITENSNRYRGQGVRKRGIKSEEVRK